MTLNKIAHVVYVHCICCAETLITIIKSHEVPLSKKEDKLPITENELHGWVVRNSSRMQIIWLHKVTNNRKLWLVRCMQKNDLAPAKARMQNVLFMGVPNQRNCVCAPGNKVSLTTSARIEGKWSAVMNIKCCIRAQVLPVGCAKL